MSASLRPSPIARGDDRCPSRAARPVTIATIRIGESAIQAATKRLHRLIWAAGLAGLVVGMAIAHGLKEEPQRFGCAVRKSPAEMAQDVEKSNAKIKQLADTIKDASASLREKKFPETFAADLARLNIPFDGGKLFEYRVGTYDGPTLTILFRYLHGVDVLNDHKDALHTIAAGRTRPSENETPPAISYALIVTRTPKGQAMGSLAPLLGPLHPDTNAGYPKEFMFQDTDDGSLLLASKYECGDAFSTPQNALGILVEPRSVHAAFPGHPAEQIAHHLTRLDELINGTGEGNSPRPGLAKDGAALVERLKHNAGGGL